MTQQQSAEGTAPAEKDPEWYKSYADILNYAVSLNWEFPGQGTLDLLSAGRQGDSYSARVNSFNWQDFYDRRGGGVFLNAVKKRMQEEYDYILIDSRTGVSDTAGICTVQMPDVVVVCFTLNNQGARGTAAVARSIYEQRLKSHAPVEIFPVPMRVEPFEKNKLDLRRNQVKQLFNLFPAHLAPTQRAKFQDDVQVQYLPYYAYEEILATFGNKPNDAPAISLLYPTERLAEYVTGFLTPESKVSRLAANEALERQRELILARFEGKEIEPEPDAAEYLLRVGDATFTNLTHEEQELAKRAILQMIRYARPDESEPHARVTVKLAQFDEPCQQVLRQLASCPLLIHEGEIESPQATFGLASDVVLHTWPRLQDWIKTDFEFLFWRQQLRGKLAEWERDHGALLADTPLAIAQRYREQRAEELNQRELNFIRESEQEANRKLEQANEIAQQLKDEREQKSSLEDQQSVMLRRRRWAIAITSTIILLGLAFIVGLIYFSYQNNQAQKDLNAALAKASSLTIDGIDLAKQGDFAAAISKFDEAIKLKPDYAEAHLQKANTYQNNGEFERAIGTYNQTLELKPDLVEAVGKRGTAKLSLNDFDGAINDFTEVIKSSPPDPDTTATALRNRGEAQQQKNNLDAALADYDEAIKLMPELALNYLKRGTALNAKGDKKQASASYQTALELASKSGDENTRASAQAGLRQLGVKTAPVTEASVIPAPSLAPPIVTKIFLHYQDAKDEKVLAGISTALTRRQYAIAKIQRSSQPTDGDVRYFYEEDRPTAVQVKQITEQTLQKQRIEQSLELRFLSGFAGKAPRGQIEVWLPPLTEMPTPNQYQRPSKDNLKQERPLLKSKKD